MMLTTLASCVGPQGEQGIQGEQGPQGLPGKDGVNGINGTNGVDGAPGKDGVTPTIEISSDGYWIINGVKTEYKAIGIDGTNGTNGVGIASTTMDENGNIVITYTNGTVDVIEHNWIYAYTLKAPTCTEVGIDHYSCKDCNLVRMVTTEMLTHSFVDGNCTICGVKSYTRDGDYIYFGEYPQTIKADDVTITDTQDSRGYYLGSDGFYYAKVIATPYKTGYTFSIGSTVTSGEAYYFKVELIRWRILSIDGEKAFIHCDSIIANHRYDDDSNNYAESEIREWLNETFYETAFNTLQRDMILTTAVDNSAATTGSPSNPYTCEDTEDKVFLLSYKDITNSEYGFSTTHTVDEARKMITSDYTRATGAFMDTSSDYYGNGYWLLRSPSESISYGAMNLDYSGRVGSRGSTHLNDWGIVPAMWINLNP